MPSPWITINDVVIFDGTGDVFVKDGILDFNETEIKEMLALAMRHKDDEFLNRSIYDNQLVYQFISEEHVGGVHGMCVTLEGYLLAKEKYELQAEQEIATRSAKKVHMNKRRREFQKIRSDLVLALLNRGDAYVCYVDGCKENADLTIDHLVPVSKGGTDGLSNLRFACRSHNSQRGAGRFD